MSPSAAALASSDCNACGVAGSVGLLKKIC